MISGTRKSSRSCRADGVLSAAARWPSAVRNPFTAGRMPWHISSVPTRSRCSAMHQTISPRGGRGPSRKTRSQPSNFRWPSGARLSPAATVLSPRPGRSSLRALFQSPPNGGMDNHDNFRYFSDNKLRPRAVMPPKKEPSSCSKPLNRSGENVMCFERLLFQWRPCSVRSPASRLQTRPAP